VAISHIFSTHFNVVVFQRQFGVLPIEQLSKDNLAAHVVGKSMQPATVPPLPGLAETHPVLYIAQSVVVVVVFGAVIQALSIQLVPVHPHGDPPYLITQGASIVIASHLSGIGTHPAPVLLNVQELR
jgi:hypothetical protein